MLRIICGDKILLRPIELSDTELIVKWRNTDEVKSQFVFQKAFTNEIHNHWMKTKVASGEVIQYIIEIKDTGKPIGSVYFRDIDIVNISAEFGIFIGEVTALGKGYGSETAILFTEFGFSELKLHRIFLRVFTDNIGAIKSYKKAGFSEEGIAKDMVFQNGKFRSMTFMSKISES